MALSSLSSSVAPCSIMAAVNCVVKVSATCCGSEIPVDSIRTYSTSPLRASSTRLSRRSPRRVQQMQPFWSWINFSLLAEMTWLEIREASMLILQKSITEHVLLQH